MKILVLSFYYQPDLCAGSFRCTALVKQLLSKDENCTIDVISTLPNRYSSFSVDAQKFEQNGRLKVYRIELPTHKSGMFDQAKSFVKYYLEVKKIIKNRDYDIVVATSSRLFTAFLGARIASKRNLPLYLDIRDIFVDTLKNVLSPKFSLFVIPVLNLIEKYTFLKATKVNLVSEGFSDYFESRYPQLEYEFFTNGIDEEFLDLSQISIQSSKKTKTILYAGNIGEGQGLHKIIPELAEMLKDDYQIKILGDGGRKHKLIDAIKEKGIINVELLDPVDRKTLIEHYQRADVLFLHLNDYDAFKKVLPSKIFEYGAFNKPILAGVSGYAAKFIETSVSNALVFKPCDANSAYKALLDLVDVDVKRDTFITKFKRTNIMEKMANSIINTAKKS